MWQNVPIDGLPLNQISSLLWFDFHLVLKFTNIKKYSQNSCVGKLLIMLFLFLSMLISNFIIIILYNCMCYFYYVTYFKGQIQIWKTFKPSKKHCVYKKCCYKSAATIIQIHPESVCRRVRCVLVQENGGACFQALSLIAWVRGSTALCLLMNAIQHSVWGSEREEQNVWWQRVQPVWLMHDDILWVKGEGPTPDEQFPDHKYFMSKF